MKYGRYSERPYLDIQIPTLIDSSLAPDGQHLMSVTVKYVPYHLRQENWDAMDDVLRELVLETIAEYAPDVSHRVQQYRVITPLDLETIYNLPEGNLVH
ncbi:MAG: amine oxidase, partial [Phycisphaerae bacterium]|nr:amine oxidase [Phycisphaerae bacterium]